MKPIYVGVLAAVVLPLIAWGATPFLTNGTSSRTPHGHGLMVAQNTQQPPLLSYIPTYYQHVKPILEKACIGCHTAGEIAPFSLNTPADAVKHARQMQLAVQSKRMPPWLPSSQSLKFLNERKLSDEEIAIVANWAWAGAPLGKATASSAGTAALEWKPDLVLDTGRDFRTNPQLTDEWRCFLVEPKLTEARFLTAFNIRASNPQIVHHVGLFQVTTKGMAQAKELEAKGDGRGGYPCLGSAGVESRGIGLAGFWLPGSGAVRLPAKTGIRLLPQEGLVLQVHYNSQNGQGTDRTKAELVLAPADQPPEFPMQLNAFIAQPEIPCAGDYPTDPSNPCNRDYAYNEQSKLENLTFGEQGRQMNAGFRSGLMLGQCNRKLSEFISGSSGKNITASCETTLLGESRTDLNGKRALRFLLPHMHMLASGYKLELLRDGKVKTLLEIPQWDFHWQNGYFLAEPLVLQAGDKLRHTCIYDNSPENQPIVGGVQRKPQYVVWGERSFDEMCASVYGYIVLP